MKKRKKLLVSALGAGLLSLSCISGSLSAWAFADSITNVVQAGLNTIAQTPHGDEAFSNAYYETLHRQSLEGTVVGSVSDALGTSSVKLANYTYFCGKYAMVYLDGAYNQRQIMVECSMYYRDDVPSNIDQTAINNYITDNSGRSYLANNIYFDIWRDDGSHNRYRYWTSDILTMSQYFDTSTWSGATGFVKGTGITIYRNNNSTYYDVSDGSAIGTAMSWTPTNRNVVLNYRSDNCIWIDQYGNTKSPSYNPTSQVWFSDENGAYRGTYPLDEEICKGAIHHKTQTGGSSSTSFSTAYKYTIGYIDTNSPQIDKIYSQNFGGRNSNTFIYNYDTTYQGDTIIDNTNKSTIFDGTLNNCFDLSGNVILPVDLNANITPLINTAIANLDTKLTDFFVDMPDFGDLWTNRNVDNNYYQLDYPQPEMPPTTGDINVTVDITRPLIPEVNTNPHVSFSYQTVTTTALPPSVLHAGAEIVEVGKDITDMCGTTNLIVVCGLIGVGVMLIFKDW